ncbi:alpha/beta fold hydrolase [Umezawaea endophytica]|uniref:Alpha/beta fold hydrolase n=1 Tax=Umezawaea endophytica TaxID=1654476 RepID=A0A9X3AIH2_9PSEU|nr:alpha/beta fold hydrolase [Umezawaea endophytica]MCS7482506.1 alpha/beta fold hydrolase [Umezawaea endophytica]
MNQHQTGLVEHRTSWSYTDLPLRAREAITAFAPAPELVADRLAQLGEVPPRAADREGDVEVLDGVAFTHHFTDAPGDHETVRWHHVEAGEGEPVVFLHGMPDSWFLWHHQMAAIADGYRSIAIDLKGYGQSEKGRGDYTQRGVAGQVVALLDELGLDAVTLVTHDRGTVLGDHVVAGHPERIRHYVRGEQHLAHFHPDLAPQDDLLAEAPWTGLMEDPRRFVVWAYAVMGVRQVSEADLRRTVQEFSYPGVVRAVPRYSMNSTFRKEWIERRADLMPRWRCPITVVQGHDSRSQPREFYEDAAEHLPQVPSVDLRLVPGGHFWPLESPAEVSAALREVLDSAAGRNA